MIVAILITLLRFFSFSNQVDENKVTIAAAANTQFVMKALAAEFEKQYHIKVELIFGSSGKLTAQIVNGAPYDLFLAANMEYPTFLFDKGVTTSDPIVYAQGVAVIWTLKDIELVSPNTLTEPSIKKIAIANPRTAPYGILAESFLKTENLYQNLEEKLVFGSSVSQVNQYILLKTVDAGITSKSVVLSPEMKGRGTWVEIPYMTLDQGMVMLKYGSKNNQENMESFYAFLQSETARQLFLDYGYLTGF